MTKTKNGAVTERRVAIADAAIHVLATQGLRSLTHRAVDAELGLAGGSTSYYSRTRRELIESVIYRLASRTELDLQSIGLPLDLEAAADAVTSIVESLATTRREDQLARFALLIELRDDPELHDLISAKSPIRMKLLASASALLKAIGIETPEQHAANLIAVMDGLVFDRLVGTATANARATLLAYLRGLDTKNFPRETIN